MAGVALALVSVGCATAGELPPAGDPAFEGIAWLAGSWVLESETAAGEVMLTDAWGDRAVGVFRVVHRRGAPVDGSVRIEEVDRTLRVTVRRDGAVVGRFRVVEAVRGRVVLERDVPGFPSRILIWGVGEGVRARLEGPVEGSEEWLELTWRPADGP